MQSLESTPLRRFFVLLAVGALFYLGNCLFQFREHPDLPWYASGIYDGTSKGFLLIIAAIVVAAFGQLLLGRGK